LRVAFGLSSSVADLKQACTQALNDPPESDLLNQD